jgi:hypothetical protein
VFQPITSALNHKQAIIDGARCIRPSIPPPHSVLKFEVKERIKIVFECDAMNSHKPKSDSRFFQNVSMQHSFVLCTADYTLLVTGSSYYHGSLDT